MNRSWHTFLKTRALAPCAHEFSNEISASWNSKPSVFKTCNYAVLALTGDDAATFLQGQTTCDVLGLGPNHGTPGAICNPKGRVLTTFFLFPQEAGYRVLLPEKLAPAIEKRLRLYVLRSRVKIENLSDSLAIFGLSCDVLPKTIEHGNEGSGDERYPVLHAENRRFVKIGPKQWLFIGNPEAAERDWIDFISREGFAESGNEVWNLLSILNGIP
ncbi:MAG: YgfZ/GcvT domain-containing protein, partial [Gammaproteobacteria bacterium]